MVLAVNQEMVELSDNIFHKHFESFLILCKWIRKKLVKFENALILENGKDSVGNIYHTKNKEKKNEII